MFFGDSLQEPDPDATPAPVAFNTSSFPSKRLHGPTTFGGGGRTKIQPSVSPGPSLAHRPLLGDVRETTKGFGGAPRKEVYAALEGPGPGDYSISKPLGTDTPGFKFRADESDGTTLYMGGEAFAKKGTMGPALLLGPQRVPATGGFMSKLPRTDLLVSKDRINFPGPGTYGD